MKKGLLIILFSALLFSCVNKKEQFKPILNGGEIPDTVHSVEVIYDTVYQIRIDTFYIIPDEYLEYELMVRNVRHYVQITERNANNKKFFYGWIKRAVAN